MEIELFDYQKKAIEMIKSGSILQGGVGSGKTMTSLAYFVKAEYNKDLYIITTAKKRDDRDWEHEAIPFLIDNMNVDSWNNIHKYIHLKNAFFIFDEQRLVGNGVWVKSFLRIAEHNNWILLTATPGDTWMDYVPVFIANGFYKNRTEFIQRHVVYSRFSKFPSVDHYVEVTRLIRLRDAIIIPMRHTKKTVSNNIEIICPYDKDRLDKVKTGRWNIFKNEPIKDISELCYTMRKVVNSDYSRLDELMHVYNKHNKIIVFYNFNYELDAIIEFCKEHKIIYSQWNGHKHEKLPSKQKYLYLVQYTAGCEGWNCVDTNCIVFYSQNYSYKVMTQAAGRIDRINTSFKDLYYYHFLSCSPIDLAIRKALKNKQNFNERNF